MKRKVRRAKPQSPKARIKQLEALVKAQQATIDLGRNQYDRLLVECNGYKDRIKSVAAENESLLQDKRWFKILVQNLTGKPDALPR